VQLMDPGALGHERRDDRALERAGRGDQVGGVYRAVGSLDPEAGPVGMAERTLDLDAAADRCCDLGGIGGEVVGDPVLRREGVGVQVGELEAGEPVMPGRAVGDQRIPSLRPPPLGDPPAFEDQVRHVVAAQVLARGDPRLSAADDQRLHLFDCHAPFPPSCATRGGVSGTVGRRRRIVPATVFRWFPDDARRCL